MKDWFDACAQWAAIHPTGGWFFCITASALGVVLGWLFVLGRDPRDPKK